MNYAELLPHPRLRPFVRTYWTLSGPGAELAPQPILPDGCTELIVHRARPFWRHHASAPPERQTAHLFVGQMLAPAVIAPDGDADVVAVRFEPVGAYPLIGTPQATIADQIIDADGLGQPWLKEAMTSAQSAHNADAALRILEAALLSRLSQSERLERRTDARVFTATQLLIETGGQLTVDETARRAHTSARQLERLFQEQVGTSPKRFARVLRFQNAAAGILSGEPAPFAEISAASGYFDQAHMIRDFVTFSGTTPGQFASKLGELTRVMLS